MFDRGSEAVREEKGGSGTAESREEEAESGTEHCQKILVCLDFFILTRYYFIKCLLNNQGFPQMADTTPGGNNSN